MDVGQWIAIGVAVFLGLWYVIGYFFNRKRVGELFDWVVSGIGQLGEQVRIGRASRFSSMVGISIEKAVAPYRRIEIFITVEPRENLPFWIFNLIRGKRDEIFIRAYLRGAPGQEIEVAQHTDTGFRRYIAGQHKKPFELISASHDFEIARRGRHDERTLDNIRNFIQQYGKSIARISIQQSEPHLNIRAFLSELRRFSAVDFYTTMVGLVP